MDWDNLKFFLALAEAGSLSRASEKLRVDHSTVSRRIEMLEQDLGVRVVERLSRAYRLTPKASRFAIAPGRSKRALPISRALPTPSIPCRTGSCGSTGRHC